MTPSSKDRHKVEPENGTSKMKGKRVEVHPGDRYGRLVILSDNGSRNGYRYMLCICDCGNVFETKLTFLTTGQSKSCGCIKRENVGQPIHGGSRGKLYKVWTSMKQRCFNENCIVYHHYGERGITVCSEWMDFNSFRKWAESNGYEDGLTLDRTDNNGIYSPANCRWVPMSVQCCNRRNNRIVEFKGNSKTLHEWATEIGIKDGTLSKRLRKWPLEKALTLEKQWN